MKSLIKGLCSKTPASKELGKEGKVLTGRSLGRLTFAEPHLMVKKEVRMAGSATWS